MRRPVHLLLLCLLVAAPAAAEEEPASPPKPLTVQRAADAVLQAFKAKDQATLKALAAKDEPDPWLVADELCGRAEHDAAEQLARAAPRADVETLEAYVRSARGHGVEERLRALLDDVLGALRAGRAQKVIDATETLPDESVTVLRIRLLQLRALALRAEGRAEESYGAFQAAADAALALGWLARAGSLHRQAGLTAARAMAWDLALASWRKGLALQERRGDKAAAAATRNNLGLVYRELGELEQAEASFEKALQAAEAMGEKRLAATVLGNMGIIDELRGDFAKALAAYQRALKQKKAIGDAAGASVTLGNIGAVHDSLGNYGKALATYRRCLEEREAQGDAGGAADSLGDIGSALHALGDYAGALSSYEQSIARNEALGDAAGAAQTLGNLSGLYFDLGNYEKALSIGRRAFDSKEGMGDRTGATLTLGNVALITATMGDFEGALPLYEEALARSESLGLTHAAVGVRANLAITQSRLGDHAQALATLTRALEQTKSMKDRAGTAATLRSIAFVYRTLGRDADAVDALKESTRLARRLRATPLQVLALRDLAKLHLDKGNSSDALSAAQAALTATEGLLGGLGEEQGAAAREMHARLYAIGTLAAIREGDIAEALTFLESGRAGALLDALGKREELRWKAESLSPELRQADAAARVAEKAARRRYDQAVRGGKLADTREAGKALDAASDAVRAVAGRIQRELKQQARVFYPRAETIEAIQDSLEEDQALVLYGLCLDEALALVLRRDGERVVSLGSVEAVAAMCEELDASASNVDVAAALAEARKLLVDSLTLDEGVKRVLISPEGPLCYVPFGALFESRAVAMTPSGTTHVLLRDQIRDPGKAILALGDPDYTGVSEGAQAIYYRGRGLAPLEASRKEAEVIGTRMLLGEKASEEGLREALATATSWRAVHFACHGLVNVKRPMLSSLALSRQGEDDGFLTALEILRLQIPADLAVLSACETATGRIIKGEGIVGLTRAFMFAGAPRVICSLWKVDDEATQALMIRFYELWNPEDGVEGLGAAAALQKAQAFIRGHDKWKHPYYWAAWVLWGLPE